MSDCDMPKAYSEVERKARVGHVCSDCRGDIRPGERYRYISGIWDDGPLSFKRCQDCVHMRCEMGEHMDDDSGCGGIPVGGLVDELGEWDRERFWHLCAMFNAYAEVRGSRMRFLPHDHFIGAQP